MGRMTPARSARGSATPYLLSLLLGIDLGWVNLHTDQTPFVALPLLAATAILGFGWPRRPWLWALVVGVWLSIGQALALLASMRLPYPNDLSAVVSVLAIGVVLGLVGAYAGALLARLVGRA
jgi:hypothetical protein